MEEWNVFSPFQQFSAPWSPACVLVDPTAPGATGSMDLKNMTSQLLPESELWGQTNQRALH